jgi:hemoglobin
MKHRLHPSRVLIQTKSRLLIAALAGAIVFASGCAGHEAGKGPDFFTSGSREADQRAEQRVAKVQEMRGKGADEQDPKAAPAKKSLYERLGGEAGVRAIVDDFVVRAIADPRVNWERKGLKTTGFQNFTKRPREWQPTSENVAQLKKHLAQFLALATGGPPRYEGRDIKESHASMRISNAEFDAAVGDLKATLDTLHVPTVEQKELLAIVESTRPQVVAER